MRVANYLLGAELVGMCQQSQVRRLTEAPTSMFVINLGVPHQQGTIPNRSSDFSHLPLVRMVDLDFKKVSAGNARLLIHQHLVRWIWRQVAVI